MSRSMFLGVLSLLTLVAGEIIFPKGAVAQEFSQPSIRLWEGPAPEASGETDDDIPKLWVLQPPPQKRCGTAIVVCPGGGYGHLAVDHEGQQVGQWLNSLGVTAYVLRYRLAPKYRHPTPMNDVQRAIRLVRSMAKEQGLATDRIGVMGFSAGGHLASTAATHFDAGHPEAKDPVDRHSCRPDFAILAYPVIDMTGNFGHSGSRNNLLGKDPSPELQQLMSNDRQVTKETPPTFLFHTAEDPAVPVENALAFFAALRKHGVPGEMHIYQNGPHGIGLAPGDPMASSWPERCASWMRNTGKLADTTRVAVSGKVLYKGEPLKWGQLTFVPADSAYLPIAVAIVRNGDFKLTAKNGPAVGTIRVEVRNQGDVVVRPTMQDAQHVRSTRIRVDEQPASETIEVTPSLGKLTIELVD